MSDEIAGSVESKGLKKVRLGRGLGSLLGEHASDNFNAASTPEPQASKAVPAAPTPEPAKPMTQVAQIPDEQRIWNLPIEQLYANPGQPRRIFEQEPLKDLANSIKTKGILQPIVAKRMGDHKYEIISGERRWRASQMAGMSHVPVILRKSDPRDSLELALIENIQRENLNPIEEAEAYSKLVEDYQLTQQEISEKVGKDRVTVANSLRLLNLPKEVREWVSKRELTVGQAKVLLGLQDQAKIKKVANKARSEKLTVRNLEKLVQRLNQGQEVEVVVPQSQVLNKIVKNFEEELQKVVGTKITIEYNQSKGKLSMYFYSDEELNYLVEKIRDSWSS